MFQDDFRLGWIKVSLRLKTKPRVNRPNIIEPKVPGSGTG